MRIAIFGSGGVGAYFGGRLAQFGQDVTFIARNESLTVMRERGLRVDSIAGDFNLPKVQVTDTPAEVGPVDYIICSVKCWQVEDAAKQMLPMIDENTLVIPTQNGVEAYDQLTSQLDPANVLGGMCAIIAFQEKPGHIIHNGANPLVRFSHIDDRPDPRVNKLSEIINNCSGVKSSIPRNMQVAIWQKFMLIAPWSGLGSVSRAPIGTLLKQNETRELLAQAMEEIYQLACARGISMPENSVEKTLERLESFPANSKTSMQRDIAKGFPSELDFQNGAVVRLGHEVELETPLNRYFLYSLRSLELRARGALKFNRRSSPR
ncbi:MAG: 2-dehydropantoate 2-reductase [Pseudomonadota bacterium]